MIFLILLKMIGNWGKYLVINMNFLAQNFCLISQMAQIWL